MCANTHPPLLLITAFLQGIWVFTSIIRGFLEKGHFFRKLSPIGFPEIWVCIPLVSEASSWISWVAEVPACESFKVVGTMFSVLLGWRCTLWCQTAQHKGFTGPQILGHWPIPGQTMTPSSHPNLCHQDTLWHRQETGRWQLRTSRPCEAVDHHLLEPPEGLATSPLQQYSVFRARAFLMIAVWGGTDVSPGPSLTNPRLLT